MAAVENRAIVSGSNFASADAPSFASIIGPGGVPTPTPFAPGILGGEVLPTTGSGLWFYLLAVLLWALWFISWKWLKPIILRSAKR